MLDIFPSVSISVDQWLNIVFLFSWFSSRSWEKLFLQHPDLVPGPSGSSHPAKPEWLSDVERNLLWIQAAGLA